MPNTSKITLSAAGIKDISTDEVYNVVQRDGNKTTLRHVGDGKMSEATRFIVSVRQPSASSDYYVINIAAVRPSIASTSDSQVTKQIVNRFNGEWRLHKDTTRAQVEELQQRVEAFLATADIQSVILDAENLY
uniref:Uncharacterized protein n=1 Tax=Beihai levi-like virus 18 TaxID=1922403 RepID=A0A1L3KIA0_9VIRU|nr:hypothetical protein [Beihai levi-like virus 18]